MNLFSILFLKESLNQLLDGYFPIDMLEITKTLKGYYKEPDRIAHKVLADRMGSRDPGNKPQSNDRIPFVVWPFQLDFEMLKIIIFNYQPNLYRWILGSFPRKRSGLSYSIVWHC